MRVKNMNKVDAFKPKPKHTIITREGYPFIAIGLVLTILAYAFGLILLAIVFAVLTIFVCAFFRNPKREPNEKFDENSIFSPADGKVIAIEKIKNDLLIKGPALKVSIFMSVFNCHVNRSPIKGLVENVFYNKGRFFVASLDKASVHNERNTVILLDEKGRKLVLVQIAGFIARRIVSYLREGFKIERGARLGVIRFGSRVDLYFPDNSVLLNVGLNAQVRAGKTIVGRWQ